MRHRRGIARCRLGGAESAEHLGAHVGSGRLGDGAAEVRKRGIGRASLHRDLCRGAQDVDPPGALLRASGQDMRCDALHRGAGFVQERGGRRMTGLAPAGGQVAVDRASDNRVGEADRILVAQDLGAGEQLRDVHRTAVFEPCQAGGVSERAAIAEDR